MLEAPNQFEPFLTVSLMNQRPAYSSLPAMKIALTSNCPGTTAIHTYDAPAARRLVVELNKLIDALEPPMVVTDKILRGKQKIARKTKKAKRK